MWRNSLEMRYHPFSIVILHLLVDSTYAYFRCEVTHFYRGYQDHLTRNLYLCKPFARKALPFRLFHLPPKKHSQISQNTPSPFTLSYVAKRIIITISQVAHQLFLPRHLENSLSSAHQRFSGTADRHHRHGFFGTRGRN